MPPPAWTSSSTGSSGRARHSAAASQRPMSSWRNASLSGTSPWRAPERHTQSPRRSMEPFAAIPEQAEAKRLLAAALADGEAHALLFHGPAGVGKTAAAFALAGALLGDARRV